MKVYIAAPLFNEMERERNLKIKKFIEKLGFEVFLGQENVGISYDLIDESNKSIIRKKIFDNDVKGVKDSDVILFLLDGRTPDEGACIEIGMAYAFGKTCIGYKTDYRAMDQNGDNNIMVDGCIGSNMASSLEELKQIFFLINPS